DGDGMRTLVRRSCGSSEEEDEDGGGRDGPWSATDEDPARRPRWGSARGGSQDTEGRATDRWVSALKPFFFFLILCVVASNGRVDDMIWGEKLISMHSSSRCNDQIFENNFISILFQFYFNFITIFYVR
ncbi:hypothetical protein WN55_02806, partial [Dufourea novaeangliae]